MFSGLVQMLVACVELVILVLKDAQKEKKQQHCHIINDHYTKTNIKTNGRVVMCCMFFLILFSNIFFISMFRNTVKKKVEI